MEERWTHRLSRALWRRRHLPAPVAGLLHLVRFTCAVVRDLFVGHLTLRATGLVYVTILSVVPVVAISFSVLKAFGFHRQMQPFLNSVLAPLGPEGAQITAHIIDFVNNVRGNLLAGVGLALLFVTTVSMAERVEDAFNFIWRVERPRNLARKLSDYLTVLLLGPVVFASAMGIITLVQHTALVRQVAHFESVGTAMDLLGQVGPYVIVCAAFTFIYWFMPNTRVQPRAAAIGGLVGGCLWAGMGVLFAQYVVTSAQALTVYATFAIAIFTLIWLYLCWLTLLIGAQVSFYAQHPSYLPIGYRPLVVGSQQQEQMALTVMLLVAGAFRRGEPRPTVESAARAMDMPPAALAPVLASLEAAGLLTRSEAEDLLPNRDPAAVPLRDILAAVREPQARDPLAEGRWPPVVAELGQTTWQAVDNALAGATLADLVTREGATSGETPIMSTTLAAPPGAG